MMRRAAKQCGKAPEDCWFPSGAGIKFG
jgi:hypothetical protein